MSGARRSDQDAEQQYNTLLISFLTANCLLNKGWLGNRDLYSYLDAVSRYGNKIFISSQPTHERIEILQILLMSRLDLDFKKLDFDASFQNIYEFINDYKVKKDEDYNAVDFDVFYKRRTDILDELKNKSLSSSGSLRSIINYMIEKIERLKYDPNQNTLIHHEYDGVGVSTHVTHTGPEAREVYQDTLKELYVMSLILKSCKDINNLSIDKKRLMAQRAEKSKIFEHRILKGTNLPPPVDRQANFNANESYFADDYNLRSPMTIAIAVMKELANNASSEKSLNDVNLKLLMSELFRSRTHMPNPNYINVDHLMNFFINIASAEKSLKTVCLEIILRLPTSIRVTDFIKRYVADSNDQNDPEGKEKILKLLENSFLSDKYFGNPDVVSYLLNRKIYGVDDKVAIESDKGISKYEAAANEVLEKYTDKEQIQKQVDRLFASYEKEKNNIDEQNNRIKEQQRKREDAVQRYMARIRADADAKKNKSGWSFPRITNPFRPKKGP